MHPASPPFVEAIEHAAKERVYLASLDGLRFVAFFAVLLNHVVAPTSMEVVYAIHGRGWVGVELFFVISAFLFFTLFQVEYRRTGRIAVGNFFVRRLLRIYPLMVGAPLMFMVLSGMYSKSAWLQLRGIALFTDNLLWLDTFRREIPWTGHLWTLSFEFQVYLMLPGIFYACVKLGRARALWLLLAIWLVCLALRARYDMEPHPFIYFAPWLRPDSILLGMALALIAPTVKGGIKTAVVAFVASVIAFFSIPNVHVPGASLIILYPVAAVLCGSMLWLALRAPWVRDFLGSSLMVYLGKRTFGIYVFHLAMVTYVYGQVSPRVLALTGSQGLTYVVAVVLTAAGSIAAAVVSYRYFERPFLLLKDARAVVLSRPV